MYFSILILKQVIIAMWLWPCSDLASVGLWSYMVMWYHLHNFLMIKDWSEKFGTALPAKEYDMEIFPLLYHCLIILLLHLLFFSGRTFWLKPWPLLVQKVFSILGYRVDDQGRSMIISYILWGPISLLFSVYLGGHFSYEANHLPSLVPRLRMCGSIASLSHYVMACCLIRTGMTLPYCWCTDFIRQHTGCGLDPFILLSHLQSAGSKFFHNL